MTYGYDIEYAGASAESIGMYVIRRPDIPAPERDMETIIIPGRDGALHKDNGRYNQIEIKIEFNYLDEPEKWSERWRCAKRWLSARNAKLKLSDDAAYHYFVYLVKLETNERVAYELGRFTAAFLCAPYMYLDEGNIERKQEFEPVFLSTARGEPILDASGTRLFSTCMSKTLVNAMDTCHPLYRVVGNGICSFSINGNWMHADVKGELIIDTELQAAYRQDGVKMNQKVTGDYTKLYLLPGQNELMTGSEFDFYITPRWRAL